MDDLYQNAWSETTDSATTFKNGSTSSWTSPRIVSSLDEEADLAAPSWSTGADLSWNEPGSPGFSWSQTDTDAGWGPSTYEGISLGKPSAQEKVAEATDSTKHDDGTPDGAVIPITSPPATEPVPSPTTQLPSPPSSPPASPEPIPVVNYEVAVAQVAPPSPDGFGSFESGLEEDAHSPGLAVDDTEADPWGSSAWGDTRLEEEEEAPLDEWERAKQEKAKQDRRVVSGGRKRTSLITLIHFDSSLRSCSLAFSASARHSAVTCARNQRSTHRTRTRTPGVMIAVVEWTESRGCESTSYLVAHLRH